MLIWDSDILQYSSGGSQLWKSHEWLLDLIIIRRNYKSVPWKFLFCSQTSFNYGCYNHGTLAHKHSFHLLCWWRLVFLCYYNFNCCCMSWLLLILGLIICPWTAPSNANENINMNSAKDKVIPNSCVIFHKVMCHQIVLVLYHLWVWWLSHSYTRLSWLT